MWDLEIFLFYSEDFYRKYFHSSQNILKFINTMSNILPITFMCLPNSYKNNMNNELGYFS